MKAIFFNENVKSVGAVIELLHLTFDFEHGRAIYRGCYSLMKLHQKTRFSEENRVLLCIVMYRFSVLPVIDIAEVDLMRFDRRPARLGVFRITPLRAR